MRYGTWFLLKTDTPIRPLIFQRFTPKMSFPDVPEADQGMYRAMSAVELQVVMRGGENIDSWTMMNDEYLVGARAVYSAGYGMWQNAVMVKSFDWA